MRGTQALVTLLLAAPSALALEASNRVLTMLPGPFNKNASQTQYFSVLFSQLTIDGQPSQLKALRNTSAGPAAKTAKVGTPGLPQLRADYDTATITVTRNASVPVALNAVETQVYGCYAMASMYDRAWRKANNNTELDKQCPWYIGKLPVNGGSLVWNINPDTPLAVMFVRAYQYCRVEDTADELNVCAFGNSPGVIQVNPIQTHPGALIGSTVALIFLGPLCLIGWYVYESKFKKWD